MPGSTPAARTTPITRVVAVLTAALLLGACSGGETPGPTVVPEGSQQTSDAPVAESPTADPFAPSTTTSPEPAAPTTEGPTTQAPTSEAAPEASGAGVVGLTMCSGQTFDEATDRCPAPEEQAQTSALHCSGTLSTARGGDVTVVFARDGVPVQTLELPLTDDVLDREVPFDADTSVGELSVPGGLWSCEVTLPDGSSGEASMQVEGPGEALSQGRACSTEDTLVTEDLTHCLVDEAVLASDLEGITCSVLLVGVDQEDITISLEVDGVTRPLGAITAPLGMIVAHVSIEPVFFGGTTFPAGDYRCVFETDTEASGSHDFTVAD